jgi:hypothetical protein
MKGAFNWKSLLLKVKINHERTGFNDNRCYDLVGLGFFFLIFFNPVRVVRLM